MKTREIVAHHEAGHFVAAYFQGTVERIREVTIEPSGSTAGRINGEDPIGEDAAYSDLCRGIIELSAGYAAEILFDPSREDEAREGEGRDDECIATWLGWVTSDKTRRADLEKRLRCEAKALIEDHWPSVVALASELLQHTTLDAYEATYVVAIAEGPRAESALAAYRRYLADGTWPRPTPAERARRRAVARQVHASGRESNEMATARPEHLTRR